MSATGMSSRYSSRVSNERRTEATGVGVEVGIAQRRARSGRPPRLAGSHPGPGSTPPAPTPRRLGRGRAAPGTRRSGRWATPRVAIRRRAPIRHRRAPSQSPASSPRLDRADRPSPAARKRLGEALAVALGGASEPLPASSAAAGHQIRQPCSARGVTHAGQLALAVCRNLQGPGVAPLRPRSVRSPAPRAHPSRSQLRGAGRSPVASRAPSGGRHHGRIVDEGATVLPRG